MNCICNGIHISQIFSSLLALALCLGANTSLSTLFVNTVTQSVFCHWVRDHVSHPYTVFAYYGCCSVVSCRWQFLYRRHDGHIVGTNIHEHMVTRLRSTTPSIRSLVPATLHPNLCGNLETGQWVTLVAWCSTASICFLLGLLSGSEDRGSMFLWFSLHCVMLCIRR